MQIVEKIRDLCAQNQLTLAGLERELGLSQGSVRKWDDSYPSVDKLLKVAEFFNVPMDYFLDREIPLDQSRLSKNEKQCVEILRSVDDKTREYILAMVENAGRIMEKKS